MPEIIVYLLEGRSIEAKRELVKGHHCGCRKKSRGAAGGGDCLAGRDAEDRQREGRRPVQ